MSQFVGTPSRIKTSSDPLAAGPELEMFRAIVSNSLAPLACLDLDLRFLVVNAACSAWCATAAVDMIGRDLLDVLGPGANGQAVAQAAAAEAPACFTCETPEGRTWTGSLAPVLGPGGSPRGFVLSLVEAITPRAERSQPEQRQAPVRDAFKEQRERLIRELELERAKLKAIFDEAPVGIEVMDAQGRFLMVNGAAAKLWGKVLPIGEPYAVTAHLDARRMDGTLYAPRDLPLVRSALDGESHSGVELSVSGSDGTRRDLLTNTRPVFDDKAKLSGAIGVFQDITERRRAQEQLRRREQEFRALVENSPDTIVRIDRAFRRTYVNEAISRISGLPASAFLGKHIIEPATHERADVIRNFREALTNVFATAQEEVRVSSYSGPRGMAWLQTRFVPELARDGTVEAVLAITRDITDFKRLEDQLRQALEGAERRAVQLDAVFEAIAEGLVMTDMTGAVTAINPAASAMVGSVLRDNEQDRLEQLRVMLPDGTAPEPEGTLFARALRGESACEGVYQVHAQGRAPLWLAASAAPIKLTDGTQVGVVVVLKNITRDRQLNEELVEARRRAEAASEAKSWFLANMSHEIRTPINGILGMTDLALMTQLTPQQRDYLTMVRQSAASLLDIINDVLDLSRIEAGRFELRMQAFDLRQVLETTLRPLRLSAHQKGLAFELDVDERIPTVLWGDDGRLRQIVVNLVSNALKFTDVGKLSVTASLREAPAHGAPMTLLFKVADTGIGIPPTRQPSLFEAFSQVGTSAHIKYGGTGLGLSISKQIVELMGGAIWLHSAPGRGSTFAFTFPTSRARAGGGGAAVTVKTDQVTPPAKKLRVLLAEDNDVNRILAKALLEQRGHHVVMAEDGRRVLEAVEREPFDLILMDVRMPEVTGEQATRMIRASERPELAAIPIVALTAHALSGDKERFLAAGMDDYLSKPIDLEELDRVLRRFGDGYRRS